MFRPFPLSFAPLVAAFIAISGSPLQAGVANSSDLPIWAPNGMVYAAKRSGNILYVGGTFTRFGPFTGNGAVLSTTTGLVTLVGGEAEKAYWGTISNVNDAASDGNGGWYIGGNFMTVGGQSRNNLAHILSNGTVDPNWNPCASWTAVQGAASHEVYELDFDAANNKLYVAGQFSAIGGTTQNNLVRIDGTTGAVDTTFAPNPSSNVMGMLRDGTTLYVGGYFSSIGGVARMCFAVLNTTTGVVDTTWPEANQWGYCRAVEKVGTSVFVGGQFSAMGGVARNRLARIETSSGSPVVDPAFPDLAAPPPYDTSAYLWVGMGCIKAVGGTLFVGGRWYTCGGIDSRDFAAIDIATGVVDTTFPKPNSNVTSMASYGNTLYVGGTFTSVGTAARNGVAAVDVPTKTVTAWDPGINTSGSAFVNALALDASGTNIYTGGWFSSVGGLVRNKLAAIDIDPLSANYGKPTSWDPNANATVYALDVIGSRVYAGGDFTTVGGVANRYYLASLDATTGAADAAFPIAGGATSGSVRALTSFGTTLYIGGLFDNIGGASPARDKICAINTVTKAVAPWSLGAFTVPAGDADRGIRSLALNAAGDTIYAGGKFTAVGATSINNAFAASTAGAGAVLPAWAPDPSATVYAVGVDDTTVYLGGTFQTFQAGTVSQQYFAGIDSNTLSANYGKPLSSVQVSGAVVYTLKVDGNQILVGGDFNSGSGGFARNRAAALRADNSLVKAWSPVIDGIPFGSSAPVYAIVTSPDFVFLAGAMDLVDGATKHTNFAGYHRSAELLTSNLLPGATSGQAYDVTLEADGKAPIVWTFSANKPAWLSIDAGTGRLTGTPLAADGNKVYTFDITIGTANVVPYNAATRTFTLFVEGSAFTLPFSTGFESTDPIPARLTAGSFARAGVTTGAANTNGGSLGLQLDAQPDISNWPLGGGAIAPAGADDPAQWDTAAATHTGSIGGVLATTNIAGLTVSFDWKAVRGAQDWYANFVFEVNDGSGWVSGYEVAAATSAGIYRPSGATTSYTTTSFAVTGLSTAATSMEFRLRWLTKFNVDHATAGFGTGIYIDNLDISEFTGILPLNITTTSLNDGTELAPYVAVQLQATGGTQPYTWSINLATPLPSGLTLVGDMIQGTPAAGTAAASPYTITIDIADSGNPTQLTDTVNLQLTIVAAGSTLNITTASLTTGTENVVYSQQLLVVGGTAPYTWTINAATPLPTGLMLVGDTIQGTPAAGTSAGSPYSITIDVSDSTLPTAQTDSVALLQLVINPAPPAALTITTTVILSATESTSYGPQALVATGGTLPYTLWTVVGGSLPSGVTLTAAGALTGTPAAGTSLLSPYNFTVQVTDSLSVTDTQALTLTVLPKVKKVPTLGGGGCSMGSHGEQTLWLLLLLFSTLAATRLLRRGSGAR